MTIALVTMLLMYATIKFEQLISRHNPNISSHMQKSHYDSSERVDLKAMNLNVAFGVEGFLDEELKDAARYVKYLVRMYGKQDSEPFEKILDYHKCTVDDYDAFEKPSSESASPLERYIRSAADGDKSERGLLCLD